LWEGHKTDLVWVNPPAAITYALRADPHQWTSSYPPVAVCQEETQLPQHKALLTFFSTRWVLFGFGFRGAAPPARKFCESVDKVAAWGLWALAWTMSVTRGQPLMAFQLWPYQKAITQWPEPEEGPKIW